MFFVMCECVGMGWGVGVGVSWLRREDKIIVLMWLIEYNMIEIEFLLFKSICLKRGIILIEKECVNGNFKGMFEMKIL